MPNYQKLMAMFFAGVGGLVCLILGNPLLYPLGASLLSGVMCFAIGEKNGKKIAAESMPLYQKGYGEGYNMGILVRDRKGDV